MNIICEKASSPPQLGLSFYSPVVLLCVALFEHDTIAPSRFAFSLSTSLLQMHCVNYQWLEHTAAECNDDMPV